MGQSTSSTVGQADTHAQAYNKTEYTRQVMDQLLNYMIKQLSVRDLLQMSKESECKKYILFKANSIYQYFYELRIFPTKDAKGLLTFRKIEDLVNPKGEQDKERQSLCLIVAYFYTRIFQIYGALALTLIDDMNAMTSSGVMSLPQTSDARLLTPGYYEQETYYGKGGVDNDYEFTPARRPGYYPPYPYDPRYEPRRKDARESLKNFEWIRSFLSSEYEPEFGFKTQYSGGTSHRASIYIKINPSLKDMNDKDISSSEPPIQTKQNGKFYIIIGSNKYSTLEVSTNRKIGDSSKVRMSKLTYTNNYGETITTDQFNKLFSVKYSDETSKYVVEDGDMGVSVYLNNYFVKITGYLKEAVKVRKEETNSTGTTVYARRSEEGITDHLRVEKMIEDLTKRKPLGHCIARALQLLKTEPLANEAGISQICSATFAENKRTGVVKKGESLSTSPGLFALANLFYDTISIGSPRLTIGKNKVNGKSSFDQYIEFMEKLSKQYEVSPDKAPDVYEQKGLDSIRDTRDQKACPVAMDIQLSLDTTKKVHRVVKSMFQDQVNHAASCFKIISMLFNITYDKTTKKPILIKLNDNLITKGFPELERINRETRELLVNYYTNCEAKYWSGMKHVLEDQAMAANAVKKAQQKVEQEAAAKKAQQNAMVAKEKADAKAAANVRVAELTRRTEELRAAQQRTINARQAAATERKAQEKLRIEERSSKKMAELEQRVKQQLEQETLAKQALDTATIKLRQAQAAEAQREAELVKRKEDYEKQLQERRQPRGTLVSQFRAEQAAKVQAAKAQL